MLGSILEVSLWIINFILYYIYFCGWIKIPKAIMRISMLLAIGFHATYLFAELSNSGYIPLYNFLSGMALAIAIMYLFIEFSIRIHTTGFIILFFVVLLQVLSQYIDTEKFLDMRQIYYWYFISHIILVMIAYAAFFIAAVYSIVYLVLFMHIRKKIFDSFVQKMPSLEELDQMNTRSVIFGLLSFTCALVLGYLWQHAIYSGVYSLDIKVILSWVTWSIYTAHVITTHYELTTEKKRAYLSLYGFICIILATTSGMIFTDFHNFYAK